MSRVVETMKRAACAVDLRVMDADEEAACPLCTEKWNVNMSPMLWACCCKEICGRCAKKMTNESSCPFCRAPLQGPNGQALTMLRKCVKNGNPVAIRELGRCYNQGAMNTKKDSLVAAAFFKQAAELGDARAALHLGRLFSQGDGVKHDEKKAVAYYRMAADWGFADAQCSLGDCFHKGEGVAKDDAEALRLFKLAADRGHTTSESNLGIMYVRRSLFSRSDGRRSG